jgi:hypothetical protein
MRKLMTTIAAAAIGAATLLTVQPASAQVGIELGGPGVGVRIGEPRDRYRDREDRVRVYDSNRGDCRTVTVRRERDDGTIVTRQERRCD